MAKVKRADKLVAMKCSVCSRRNYHTSKNKKTVERKLEMAKFCPWCRKQTKHKEARIGGK